MTHFDVLDRVGDAILVDIGEFPQRLFQEVLRTLGEPKPSVHRLSKRSPRLQICQAAFHRIGGRGKGFGGVYRHKRPQSVKVMLGTLHVFGSLIEPIWDLFICYC